MEFTVAVLCVISGLAAGSFGGYTYHKKSEEKKIRGALSESERIIRDATKKPRTRSAISSPRERKK